MDIGLFGNPWEHIRLLSDARRNRVLLEVLRRRAPGARVVEVGCGTGLLSVAAAKLGAEVVYAVEPTPLVEVAEALVAANGVQDRVQVLHGMVEDQAPREVDLAISELLNSDPFVEGVLEAADEVAPWLAKGAHLSPYRLRVWVAAIREPGSAMELRDALGEMARLHQELDLEVGPLREAFSVLESYRYVSASVDLASRPALVWDLPLGRGARPERAVRVVVEVEEPGPIGGAVIWFEADYDEGLTLDNAPGNPGHWGNLVCAWDREIGARRGPLALVVTLDDDQEVDVRPG